MPRKGENIYKRKDGRWEGRYICGKKPDGKKKYGSVYGKTYMEVKQKLITLKSSIKIDFNSVQFKAAACKWLDYSKQRVKLSTHANYTYIVEKHLLPYFKNKNVESIDIPCVNHFINEKLKNGKLKQNKGISKKYMQDILSILKSIMKFCEQEYNTPYKIATVTSPRPEKKEIDVLKKDDMKKLSSYLTKNTDRINICILIAMFTGLRIGEVCGLKWSDFNYKDKTLTIRQTVQRITNNKGSTVLIRTTPKTSASARTIPIPDKLCKIIYTKIEKNSEYISNAEPYTVRRRFKHVLEMCDVKNMRFHDLRHNFASWGLRLNFDIKTLSEILGHSNTAMTLNLYAHTSMEQKKKYMDLLKL